VVAVTADQPVVARVAAQLVAAGAADHDVVACAAGDVVGAAEAAQHVVRSGTVDDLAALIAVDAGVGGVRMEPGHAVVGIRRGGRAGGGGGRAGRGGGGRGGGGGGRGGGGGGGGARPRAGGAQQRSDAQALGIAKNRFVFLQAPVPPSLCSAGKRAAPADVTG